MNDRAKKTSHVWLLSLVAALLGLSVVACTPTTTADVQTLVQAGVEATQSAQRQATEQADLLATAIQEGIEATLAAQSAQTVLPTPTPSDTATEAVPTATSFATPAPVIPTATPTPTPGPMCEVVSTTLKMRDRPGMPDHPHIRRLVQGDRLVPLGRTQTDYWLNVRVLDTGEVGWVRGTADYVVCNSIFNNFPVVDAPPTYTPTVTPTSMPIIGLSPQEVVRAFYLAVDDGLLTDDYRLAFSYLSSSFQSRRPYATFAAGYNTTADVAIEEIRLIGQGSRSATVYASVLAVDDMGDRLLYRRFEFNPYYLVVEGQQWRIERSDVQTTILAEEDTAQPSVYAKVDPVTAWNGLWLRDSINGTKLNVMPANRLLQITGDPRWDGDEWWYPVRDTVTGSSGWDQDRYLLLESILDKYADLYWRPDCSPDDPVVEILLNGQSRCNFWAATWGLSALASELRTLGLLAQGEWLESVDISAGRNRAIAIRSSSNSRAGWVRIGKEFPLSDTPSPVAGIWRTAYYEETLVGSVCWLLTDYTWLCEDD